MKTKLSPLTDLALDAIDDLKGLDVRLLDVRSQTPMTDAMIVCTGTSTRHVRSIAENVIRDAKKAGHQPQGVEGLNGSEWVLVDLGGVVVHVMLAQTRIFYQLEKLWEMTPPPEARPAPKKKPAKVSPTKKAGKAAPKKKSSRGAPKPRPRVVPKRSSSNARPARKSASKSASKPARKSASKPGRKAGPKSVKKGKPKRRS